MRRNVLPLPPFLGLTRGVRCAPAAGDLVAGQYRICAEAYPAWEPLLCDALELACVPSQDWGAGDGVSRRVSESVAGMACLVEDLALRAEFPGAAPPLSLHVPAALRPDAVEHGGWRDALRRAMDAVPSLAPLPAPVPRPVARKDPLPALAIAPTAQCARVPADECEGEAQCLALVEEPVHYVGAAADAAAQAAAEMDAGRYRYSLGRLGRSRRRVQVRASPSNLFVFCRSTHPLIASGAFSPPSVTCTMSESEFAARCVRRDTAGDGGPPPVAYPGGGERVYMQSRLPAGECLLETWLARRPDVVATQRERVWVSTAGSVSALHYDASHSVLLQVAGRKRMILFPPETLPTLGVYPLGHPLVRRARVDLSEARARANELLFDDFWSLAALGATGAQEVVLEPGDACTFPPGWAHYTETLDCSGSHLSVSHTFRFTAA